LCEVARDGAAVGVGEFVFGGQEDLEGRVIASQVRDAITVAEDDGSSDAAAEGGGVFRSGGVGFGPAQDAAPGIGGIGGGEEEHFGSFGWVGAERAEQLDSGGLGELRSAESGDEIAAADAALGFESLEDFVDGRESAGKILLGDGFAGDDAVAVEQLLGDGVRPSGLRRGRCAVGSGDESPAALRAGRRSAAGAEAGLIVLALAGARRFGLRDVRAEGVERVVGDEAAPGERPEGVDGFAGVAGADGFVEIGEEGGAGTGEGFEDGLFAWGEGFGGCGAGWEQGSDAVGEIEGDAAVAFAE
jgi:hypothetical protein